MTATKARSKPKRGVQTDRTARAFLGVAYGDALGWPNEERARARTRTSMPPTPSFRRWERRVGGQFAPYVEAVGPGEYSDDTQLMICTARSLSIGPEWWKHFTEYELPFWRVYERGGGGATKRAALAWAEGRVPWNDPKIMGQYFEAGGNGVAMRILPHALQPNAAKTFAPIASDVFLNGIATHAHPRALVGALAYAYAAYYLTVLRRPLKFGELVYALRSAAEWSAFADAKLKNRLTELQFAFPKNYEQVWARTVGEMRELLDIAQDALSKGALSVEHETLARLGCFGKESGSGTVAAATAIFLASRYATDPIHGILEAAFARGADTDTIASMTGGLLGLLSSGSQIEDHIGDLQDREYIAELGANLTARSKVAGAAIARPSKAFLSSWTSRLEECPPGDSIELPDGRRGVVARNDRLNAMFAGSVRQIVLDTPDGQRLFVNKISREERRDVLVHEVVRSAPLDRSNAKTAAARRPDAVVYSPDVVMRCKDIAKTLAFYVDVLGLRVTSDLRGRGGVVTLENNVVLVPGDSELFSRPDPSLLQLRFKTHDVDGIARRLKGAGIDLVDSHDSSAGLDYCEFLDPDGRRLAVVDRDLGL